MKKPVRLLLALIILGGCGSGVTAEQTETTDRRKSTALDEVVFTIEDMNSRKEVKPKHPSGYYHYYEKQEGYQYYVITGQAVNHGEYVLEAKNVMVQAVRDKKTYEAKLVFTDTQEHDFIQKLEPHKSRDFYFIVLMKRDQLKPEALDIYYNDMFKKAEKEDHYDYLLKWILPPYK